MAIFMTVINTRISNELDIILSNVAKEIDRPKGYIIRKAIESYIEEKADLLIALSRIEKREEVISLEDIKKKYGLED
ncbi:antitoxin [Rickettsia conorii subsp. heilongjiangensis]|uniref:Antitoxin of toxin antitoxin system n=3 Tax=spotted fever group TaxID=114277 RepID=A0AAD1FL27_RICJA|nr:MULTISPECIES: antitoxin [spotted fever group]AEK74895.1 putative antitoxin of toxin-antitoxin [Rickettsia conorii subsp. heilongjiangensis 054]AXU06719.1 antitoxin of toxin-antitoxin stability system [Rickettsia japonica]QHE25380.1 antitoxin of toxin-antitoxin stability system [Rickettsia japonica]BAK96934.1 putative antitoxin of toxin-antitoxin (TA) system [Rickettsia japonica YH]BAW82997.1 putative antitoxin of toxin antitoxin system [Rickettsia japonica]